MKLTEEDIKQIQARPRAKQWVLLTPGELDALLSEVQEGRKGETTRGGHPRVAILPDDPIPHSSLERGDFACAT